MRAAARSAGLAALAIGYVAARDVKRRRKTIAKVPADLHSPALYVTPSVASRRSLWIARRLEGLAARVAPRPMREVRTTPEGVRIIMHDAPTRSRPSGAVLWIHGGGFILGSPGQCDDICELLVREADVLVAAVTYRLAPETPFPAGLDDCSAALRWLHNEAAALGVARDRIAVAGDSAGGGLAAALCQRALDAGGPHVAFQLLEYPMLDDRTVGSVVDPDGVYAWTPASNRYAWTAYLGRPPAIDEPPPYASPARRGDLRDLPPAWIGVGDLDLFHDEDVAYAHRLNDAGVPCALHVEPGMWHGADAIIPSAPTSRRLRALMCNAIAAAVGKATPSLPPRARAAPATTRDPGVLDPGGPRLQ